ncbi:hypothetical protein PV939_06145 [Ligilactobacillus salivarius]|nr:hypothetical protein [Ligilactobacillus salivarius]
MDSSRKYAMYVQEERALFKEILALKPQVLDTKKLYRENQSNIRSWRNRTLSYLNNIDYDEFDNEEEDITSVNFDLKRIHVPQLDIVYADYLKVRRNYVQIRKRIASIIDQIDYISDEAVTNKERVLDELAAADKQLKNNISKLRKVVLKHNNPVDKLKVAKTLEILNGYAGVDTDDLFTYELIKNKNSISINYIPRKEEIVRILDKADAGDYYPVVPFEKVYDLKENYLDRQQPLNSFSNEIYHELKESSEFFEQDEYWKVDIENIITLPEIPSVETLITADGNYLPLSMQEELRLYATGEFRNTTANINRINEIAYTYHTPTIDFNTSTNSEEDALIRNKLLALTDILEKFSRKNTKLGMVISIRSSAINLLKAQDKGYIALSNAFDEFEHDVSILENWISSSWYQFGGTPENDTAYNGRGNIHRWRGKQWY